MEGLRTLVGGGTLLLLRRLRLRLLLLGVVGRVRRCGARVLGHLHVGGVVARAAHAGVCGGGGFLVFG